MTPDLFKHIELATNHAMDIPAKKRNAFLNKLPTPLRIQVSSLLEYVAITNDCAFDYPITDLLKNL